MIGECKASTLLDLAKLVGRRVGIQMRSDGGASMWASGTLWQRCDENGRRDPARFIVITENVCGIRFHVSAVDSLLVTENDVCGRAAVIWLK